MKAVAVVVGIVGVVALAGVASAQQYIGAHNIECLGYSDGTSYTKVTFQDNYVWSYWNGCSRPTNAPAVNGGFNETPWPATIPGGHGNVKRIEVTLWTGSENTTSDADDVALNTCTATSRNGYISGTCRGPASGNYEVRYFTSLVRLP